MHFKISSRLQDKEGKSIFMHDSRAKPNSKTRNICVDFAFVDFTFVCVRELAVFYGRYSSGTFKSRRYFWRRGMLYDFCSARKKMQFTTLFQV